MKNLQMHVEGKKLVIEIDLTKDLGPSASGKTTLVASTEGNVTIDGHEGFRLGLNVIKPR